VVEGKTPAAVVGEAAISAEMTGAAGAAMIWEPT
jgi:hypothetical protein